MKMLNIGIYIDKKAPNTINFIRYIVSGLLNREPLMTGKIIVMRVSEDLHNLPEFYEKISDEDGKLKTEDIVLTRDKMAEPKAKLIQYYLTDKFGSHITVKKPALKSPDPLTYILSFIVQDPKGFYEVADKILAKDNKSEIILCLDRIGNLWREPKSKYCYPIDEKSNRHKIIRYLAESNDYQPTQAIAAVLDIKNKQYIRGEIPKINNNAKRFLKLNIGKFIESKSGSGYRVSPNYKIKVLRT